MEDNEKVAFWGITLKPGEPAELELEDGEQLHVTMASFGVDLSDKSGRSVVTATIRNSQEDEGEPQKKYALCSITAGKVETICMDVCFVGEEFVTFEVSGKNEVHLVGNFAFEADVDDDEDDDDEGDLIGVYEDGESLAESDEDSEAMPRLLMDDDPPVITELPEEEVGPETKKVAKSKGEKSKGEKSRGEKSKSLKSKVPNGKHIVSDGKRDPSKQTSNLHASAKKDGKSSKDALKSQQQSKSVKKALQKASDAVRGDEVEKEDSEEEAQEESNATSRKRASATTPAPKRGSVKSKASILVVDDDMDGEEDIADDIADMADDSDCEIQKTPKVKKPTETPKSGILKSKKSKSSSKKAENRQRLSFVDVKGGNTEQEEDKTTPASSKSKKSRKRRSSSHGEEATPPSQTKRSKISQRPGTPAASKFAGNPPKNSSPANHSAVDQPDNVKATNPAPSSSVKKRKKRNRKSIGN